MRHRRTICILGNRNRAEGNDIRIEEIKYESEKDKVLRQVRGAIKTRNWSKLEKSRFRITNYS